eukprot:CAMPEP_0169430622 /NCGR_PEP_ID=MMETSP1042-20121227/2500_1 /TAXON_ID=464988 /ORGANISM="Hemiselmis andersenii, Strain CCMP1180" /LENGTH=93 /DNA_ID=CAMNT_0009540955 /DNA_START=516 /DNA_END=794 /DNA_ORIENTATION=-
MHLKGESDLGALPKLRLDSHFAPVRLDEAPDQRQSQASPLVPALGRHVCLHKGKKYLLHILLTDAYSGILHLNLQTFSQLSSGNRHAALVCEL